MNLPQQLADWKKLRVWMNYLVYEDETGKKRKPPINPHTLKNGSSTDPARWSDFDTAYRNIGRPARVGLPVYKNGILDSWKRYSGPAAGIGITLEGAGLIGIDLDHVINPETGAITDDALRIINMFDSYTEISPSGTGFHILCRASSTVSKGFKFSNPDGTVYEIYSTGRYFTVTGNTFNDCKGVEDRQQAVNSFIRDLSARREIAPPVICNGSGRVKKAPQDDNELWYRLFNGVNGKRVMALYDGDYGAYINLESGNADHSVGDLALCSYLRNVTNGDIERIDRMFRQSGMMREKWDRPISSTSGETYGERTISKVMQGFTPMREFTKEEKRKYAIRKQLEEDFKE